MTRLIAAIATVFIAVVLLVLAWPQLFGLAFTTPVAQIVSLRGLGIAAGIIFAALFALIALLARPARSFAASVAVLLLAFSALNLAVLSTRGFGNLAFEQALDSDLTVLSWNTLGDAPGAERIAQLALNSNADIITLPETTYDTGMQVAAIMANAGTAMHVYTVAYDQVSKARSTTLLINMNLGSYDVDSAAITTSVLPTVVATPTDGSGPTIIAVHTLAPVPPMVPGWKSDLQWVAGACDTSNVIMAGDFNATLDHMSGIQHSTGATLGNCADAALAIDNAAVGTWPTAIPALLGAPIDHVMTTSNWTVTGMRVIESLDGAGSDHRAILAQLSPSK